VLKSFGIEFEFIDKQPMKAGQGLKKSLAMRRLTQSFGTTVLLTRFQFHVVATWFLQFN